VIEIHWAEDSTRLDFLQPVERGERTHDSLFRR
jgi:hypothetical protein